MSLCNLCYGCGRCGNGQGYGVQTKESSYNLNHSYSAESKEYSEIKRDYNTI